MLEIYNENIRDLLSANFANIASANAGKQYAIKHDASGNTHVSDLTIIDVRSSKEVSYLLDRAAQSRYSTIHAPRSTESFRTLTAFMKKPCSCLQACLCVINPFSFLHVQLFQICCRPNFSN